jgi:hypothetical protein
MRRHLVVILVIALSACGKQDDAEKLKKSVDSWSATLQLVADARLRDEVRSGFALKTTEAAIEEQSGEAAKPGLPRSLTIRAEKVIGVAASLRQSIESDDRAGIANARLDLAGLR